MSLQTEVMTAMKVAMKDKDQTALAALRAIKSELLLAQTSGSGDAFSKDDEIKILSKLVKQRKDSAAIFTEQNRADLAEPELAQVKVISQFLPEQLDEAAISSVVEQVVLETGAKGMADMGKVMGLVSKQLAGQADGKTISSIVKAKLSS